MVKVLVIGQTPPPFCGQAIMVHNLLEIIFQQIKFYHVRMAFSSEMDGIGRFPISKLFHLIGVILQIIWVRFCNSITVLYYPPSGPQCTNWDDIIINCQKILHNNDLHISGRKLAKKNQLISLVFRI